MFLVYYRHGRWYFLKMSRILFSYFLLMCETVFYVQLEHGGADPGNKLVYSRDDPNRPRFTLIELKDILYQRNELKARLSDLEDELNLYRPKVSKNGNDNAGTAGIQQQYVIVPAADGCGRDGGDSFNGPEVVVNDETCTCVSDDASVHTLVDTNTHACYATTVSSTCDVSSCDVAEKYVDLKIPGLMERRLQESGTNGRILHNYPISLFQSRHNNYNNNNNNNNNNNSSNVLILPMSDNYCQRENRNVCLSRSSSGSNCDTPTSNSNIGAGCWEDYCCRTLLHDSICGACGAGADQLKSSMNCTTEEIIRHKQRQENQLHLSHLPLSSSSVRSLNCDALRRDKENNFYSKACTLYSKQPPAVLINSIMNCSNCGVIGRLLPVEEVQWNLTKERHLHCYPSNDKELSMHKNPSQLFKNHDTNRRADLLNVTSNYVNQNHSGTFSKARPSSPNTGLSHSGNSSHRCSSDTSRMAAHDSETDCISKLTRRIEKAITDQISESEVSAYLRSLSGRELERMRSQSECSNETLMEALSNGYTDMLEDDLSCVDCCSNDQPSTGGNCGGSEKDDGRYCEQWVQDGRYDFSDSNSYSTRPKTDKNVCPSNPCCVSDSNRCTVSNHHKSSKFPSLKASRHSHLSLHHDHNHLFTANGSVLDTYKDSTAVFETDLGYTNGGEYVDRITSRSDSRNSPSSGAVCLLHEVNGAVSTNQRNSDLKTNGTSSVKFKLKVTDSDNEHPVTDLGCNSIENKTQIAGDSNFLASCMIAVDDNITNDVNGVTVCDCSACNLVDVTLSNCTVSPNDHFPIFSDHLEALNVANPNVNSKLHPMGVSTNYICQSFLCTRCIDERFVSTYLHATLHPKLLLSLSSSNSSPNSTSSTSSITNSFNSTSASSSITNSHWEPSTSVSTAPVSATSDGNYNSVETPSTSLTNSLSSLDSAIELRDTNSSLSGGSQTPVVGRQPTDQCSSRGLDCGNNINRGVNGTAIEEHEAVVNDNNNDPATRNRNLQLNALDNDTSMDLIARLFGRLIVSDGGSVGVPRAWGVVCDASVLVVLLQLMWATLTIVMDWMLFSRF